MIEWILIGIAIIAGAVLMLPSDHERRDYRQRRAKRQLNQSIVNRRIK